MAKGNSKTGAAGGGETAKTVAALSITANRDGFRRAGYVFGKEPVVIALADLSKEQIKQLANEPLLSVTESEIDAAE